MSNAFLISHMIYMVAQSIFDIIALRLFIKNHTLNEIQDEINIELYKLICKKENIK